jgi:tetratricopeptide (TPR) repeat protein
LQVIALALAIASRISPASVEDLPVGEPPPDFTLARTDGGEVSLRSEQGQPIVLVFGELYQENTRRALADLSDILARTDQGGAVQVFVIVSENRPAEVLESERRGTEGSFPVLMDPSRSTFTAYGVISAIPCSVFLSAAGRVHRAHAGYGISFVDMAEGELAFLTGQISEEELEIRRQGPAPENAEAARLRRGVRLGDQLHQRGFNGQAREQYETVLGAAPDHVEAHLGLALIELWQSDLDAAEAHVRRALEPSPNHPRGLKTLAQIHLRRGELEAAELTLQSLIHLAGEDARTLYLMGRLAEARGDESGALQHYRQVSEALLAEEEW